MSISRRTFLETATLAGLASRAMAVDIDPKTGMPMRVLGKTGYKVSILAFGSGSRWLMYKEEDKAFEAMSKALDAGVNYVDTAHNYGNGESETRIGKLLGERRKSLWLATKLQDRTYDGFMRQFELSLKRLKTDHVNLLHMHALGNEDDLAKIEAPDGALKALYKLRDEKSARFIGVTCHQDPSVLKKCLEHNDLDCTQMGLNAGLQGSGGAGTKRPRAECFETVALPVALRKNMGVTAMKIYAQDMLLPAAKPADLVRYSMSLPVAATVIGMPKLQYVEENLQFAKSFKPMPRDEMREMSDRVSAATKASIDRFFMHHQDACDACGTHLA